MNTKKSKFFNKKEKTILDSFTLNIRFIIFFYNIKYFFILNKIKNLQVIIFILFLFLIFLLYLFSLFKSIVLKQLRKVGYRI